MKETVVKILSFAVLATTLLTVGCGVKTFKMDADAMAPTLKRGSVVVADLTAYDKAQDIQRWDIVIFHPLQFPERYWIMRVVGLPGESVTLQGGKLHVNGSIIQPPAHVPQIKYTLNPAGIDPSWFISHPVILPNDCFYLLGDNPQQAMDSRFWGSLPFQNIVGKMIEAHSPN